MCDELGDVREVQKGSLAPDFVPDLMPPRYPESISVKWKENEANKWNRKGIKDRERKMET